jgi:hypothetical protein
MQFPSWLRPLASLVVRVPIRRKSAARLRAFRPGLEQLEDRMLLSAYLVTTTADSGAGSLRDAITRVDADTNHALYASPNPGVEEIDFGITAATDTGGGYNSATGVATIAPQSTLPQITNAVLINGYTQGAGTALAASPNTLQGVGTLGVAPDDPSQYGDNAVLKVQIDGGQRLDYGFILSNSIVQGLVIDGFTIAGIRAGGGVTVRGNFIGTDVTGTSAHDQTGNFLGNGRGIWIDGGSQATTVGGTRTGDRNVISGNSTVQYEADQGGIFVYAYGNAVIQGNFIGTDRTGTLPLGNDDGVTGYVNAAGATALISDNLISGNYYAVHAQSDGFIVQGNFIGTDVTGTQAADGTDHTFGNAGGVYAESSIVFGGSRADGAGNLLVGGAGGLTLGGGGSQVQGNYLGTDVVGKPTDAAGSYVFGFSTSNAIDGHNGNNLIGGADPTTVGNLIVGQTSFFAGFGNPDIGHNTIEGNHVIRGGIGIINSSYNVVRHNTVDSGLMNGLGDVGIVSRGGFNLIEANSVSNHFFGVQIGYGAYQNLITSNVISNAVIGIDLSQGSFDDLASSNVLTGNQVGIKVMFNGSRDHAAGNVISGSQRLGIQALDGALRPQPAPALISVSGSSGGTAVTGTFAGFGGQKVRLELFANASPDAAGNYEGEVYLGATDVTVAADETFSAVIAAAVPVDHRYVTATATVRLLDDVAGPSGPMTVGDTTPFSAAFFVSNKADAAITVNPYSGVYDGQAHSLSGTATGVLGEDLSSLLSTGASYTNAGTYSAGWSFAGNADYNAANGTSTVAIAQATPTFSAVGTTVITDGTPTVTLSGTIGDGSLIPTGSVTVTVDGVSKTAAIGANGRFSATFATGSLNVGTHSISFSYGGDPNFTDASASGSLDDTYGVLALFDQTHAKHAGSTLAVKIQLATAGGQDVSAANLTVTALGIAATTDTTDTVGSSLPANVGPLTPVQAAGGSNPGNVFLCQGGAIPFYMYSLHIPNGLAAGTYRLYFSVAGDPLAHWVAFTVD